MVIKTDLCAFSEWKIYPGKGIRYIARDGRPFLYLSKRTKDFGLRYIPFELENSRPKDLDGPLPGEDSIRRLSNQTKANSREIKSSEKREPSKVSPWKLFVKLKQPDLRIRRHSLRKPSEKSKSVRKL